jgi:hypothetical protein
MSSSVPDGLMYPAVSELQLRRWEKWQRDNGGNLDGFARMHGLDKAELEYFLRACCKARDSQEVFARTMVYMRHRALTKTFAVECSCYLELHFQILRSAYFIGQESLFVANCLKPALVETARAASDIATRYLYNLCEPCNLSLPSLSPGRRVDSSSERECLSSEYEQPSRSASAQRYSPSRSRSR